MSEPIPADDLVELWKGWRSDSRATSMRRATG
jgi:hypothetical protein